MSESKHTPGPWTVVMDRGNCAQSCIEAGGNVIAQFFDRSNADAEANARLSAAAPDMLDALKVAEERLAVMEEMTECRSDDEWVWAAQEKVSAAIAKAEGRS